MMFGAAAYPLVGKRRPDILPGDTVRPKTGGRLGMVIEVRGTTVDCLEHGGGDTLGSAKLDLVSHRLEDIDLVGLAGT